MIENKEKYEKFLVSNGRGEDSAKSYCVYLNALFKHLSIDVSSKTVKNERDISLIVEKLHSTKLSKSYIQNIASALNGYLTFLNA